MGERLSGLQIVELFGSATRGRDRFFVIRDDQSARDLLFGLIAPMASSPSRKGAEAWISTRRAPTPATSGDQTNG